MFCCGDILLIVLLYCMLGVDLENAYWTIALSAFNVGSKPDQVKSSQAKPSQAKSNQVKSYHTAQKPWYAWYGAVIICKWICFVEIYHFWSACGNWRLPSSIVSAILDIFIKYASGALFQILHHRKCTEKQNITISIAPKRKKEKKRNKNHTKIDSLLRESTHFYLYLCMCVITNASPSFEKIKTWN